MNFDWKNEYYRYHRYFFTLPEVAKQPKIRSFFWLSITILSVCVCVFVFIGPTLIKIAKLNRDIKDQTEARDLLQAKIEALGVANKQYSQYAPDFHLLDEALPAKTDFPTVAYYFEEIADETGVAIKSISFEKVGDTGEKSSFGTQQYSFNITATGSYKQLKDYLQGIEDSRRAINIENTTISEQKKQDSVALILSMSGKVMYSKAPAAKTSTKTTNTK